MSMDLSDDKSTLFQVMAWCRQATSHYLCQCWPRSMMPCGVTRLQWVKVTAFVMDSRVNHFNTLRPGQKWQPFYRWHFQILSPEWNLLSVPEGPIDHVSSDTGNGWVPNRQQNTTWTMTTHTYIICHHCGTMCYLPVNIWHSKLQLQSQVFLCCSWQRCDGILSGTKWHQSISSKPCWLYDNN